MVLWALLILSPAFAADPKIPAGPARTSAEASREAGLPERMNLTLEPVGFAPDTLPVGESYGLTGRTIASMPELGRLQARLKKGKEPLRFQLTYDAAWPVSGTYTIAGAPKGSFAQIQRWEKGTLLWVQIRYAEGTLELRFPVEDGSALKAKEETTALGGEYEIDGGYEKRKFTQVLGGAKLTLD